MACKICKHPRHAEMVVDYARTSSYRKVAQMYGVNFKTLQRHISKCVYAVMSEAEEKEYQTILNQVARMLTFEFAPLPKKRPKSLITKPFEWTWSRRSWKQ